MRIVFGENITGGTHMRIPWVAEARAFKHANGSMSVSFRWHPLIPAGISVPLLIWAAFSASPGFNLPLELFACSLLVPLLATVALVMVAGDREEERTARPLPPDEPAGARLAGPNGERVPCLLARAGDDPDGAAVWTAVPLDAHAPVNLADGWTLHLDYLPYRTRVRVPCNDDTPPQTGKDNP